MPNHPFYIVLLTREDFEQGKNITWEGYILWIAVLIDQSLMGNGKLEGSFKFNSGSGGCDWKGGVYDSATALWRIQDDDSNTVNLTGELSFGAEWFAGGVNCRIRIKPYPTGNVLMFTDNYWIDAVMTHF